MTLERYLRPAVHPDRGALLELLADNSLIHRHLDWREPLDWIGLRPFLVMECNGSIVGALACPPEPPKVCWIRLFVVSTTIDLNETWNLLWQQARSELPQEAGTIIAAIVMQDRFIPLLQASHFNIIQHLVLLERNSTGSPTHGRDIPGLVIRPLSTSDLPAVVHVDSLAFIPLWQISQADLTRAHAHSFLAAVAEKNGQVVGYHLSTRNSLGVHLARLAVDPDFQGQGIGQALVQDLFFRAERYGIRRFTVNTQDDNLSSLAIYRKLDFLETGDIYPVYQYHN